MADSPTLFFLSYSRREFYFAESLALHLQHHGFDIWFDIQQLEPGINWKLDISSGLAACSSLILIASDSALQSHYVEQEWQHAIGAQKPVIVVLFEGADLPETLHQASTIVDYRAILSLNISPVNLRVNVYVEDVVIPYGTYRSQASASEARNDPSIPDTGRDIGIDVSLMAGGFAASAADFDMDVGNFTSDMGDFEIEVGDFTGADYSSSDGGADYGGDFSGPDGPSW